LPIAKCGKLYVSFLPLKESKYMKNCDLAIPYETSMILRVIRRQRPQGEYERHGTTSVICWTGL
jgi:hypothetical protein